MLRGRLTKIALGTGIVLCGFMGWMPYLGLLEFLPQTGSAVGMCILVAQWGTYRRHRKTIKAPKKIMAG